MIRSNIITVGVLSVAFTMVSFIYYYYHLRLDPMHFFGWWYSHISSFHIKNYIIYVIGFEIILLVYGIVFIRTEKDHIGGHEEYK